MVPSITQIVDEPLWSIPRLAEHLGVPVQTIYKWRSMGKGPVGIRLGRSVGYRPQDVRDWEARHRDDWEH